MFKADTSISFVSSKTTQETLNIVEDLFQAIGRSQVTPNGAISISSTKFTGFAYGTTINATWRVKNERQYSIDVEFSANPDAIGWIIAICLFPIGLAVLALPYTAKSEMLRKIDGVLKEIKFTLESATSPAGQNRNHGNPISAHAPPPVPTAKTYYLVLNNQQNGPFTEEQLRQMVAEKKINTSDLGWCDGMSDWKPINTIISL